MEWKLVPVETIRKGDRVRGEFGEHVVEDIRTEGTQVTLVFHDRADMTLHVGNMIERAE